MDLTLGMGGHSAALLEANPEARLISVDWDAESLNLAREYLKKHAQRVTFVNRNFAELEELLNGLGMRPVDGLLADLGPSSFQILQAGRGLTYQREEPLDMRMAPSLLPYPVSLLLEKISEEELGKILADFGEIPKGLARRIASRLADERSRSGVSTSRHLASVIERISPNRKLLARAFQALRIVVNAELENLKQLLAAAPRVLAPGGRLAVISFHSLEDRLVKRAFAALALSGKFKLLSKKPVEASAEECTANPKARSAKLRAVERL